MVKRHHQVQRKYIRQRPIKKVLNKLSFPEGRRKTTKLMKEAGVWLRYKNKYKATTNSDHKKPIYNNMLKQGFVAQLLVLPLEIINV
jgi:putative transposase